MLQVNRITYRVGNRTIFEDASCRISGGQRIGLVGANGSGKTTLLRLITEELELDAGNIDIQNKCSVGTVAQEAPGGDKTPLEVVLESDVERQQLLIESETATDPNRIAQIHTRLADINAHSAPARAAVILSGLGFDQDSQHRPMSTFSGGWRMRVALASALFREPDLLLLDEPTNHLDLESIMWLETYLCQYPNTLVVVSHDRDLLNQVVNGILLVKNGKLSAYTGGYDAFVKAEATATALQESTRVKQEAARKHLQSFIDRFKAKASKAKQAQSRIKALEKMAPIQASQNSRRIAFNFPGPAAKPSPLIKLDDVTVGYEPRKPILSDLHLSVFSDDRIALLGANGNGKTTLARALSNQLSSSAGHLVPAGKLKVGYFAQDHLEQLDTEITALDQMKRAMPEDSPDKVRGWLGRFGFEQQRSEVLVQNLSGGEKTRLALALLALERPNLMILDEPTNHLDMDARTALMEGLNDFDGAIILISHDRQLIESTCEQLWLVKDGTCKQYFGDINDYRTLLLSERQTRAKTNDSHADSNTDNRVSRKDARREAAQSRARLAPLKKAASEAEAQLETLTCEKDKIDQQLSDPAIYEGPSEKVQELSIRQRELEEAIAIAEDAWLHAQDELENAMDDENHQFS